MSLNNMIWKPIETAPKNGTVILGWRFYPVAIRWSGDVDWPWEAVELEPNSFRSFFINGFKEDDCMLTHWMPLPECPK